MPSRRRTSRALPSRSPNITTLLPTSLSWLERLKKRFTLPRQEGRDLCLLTYRVMSSKSKQNSFIPIGLICRATRCSLAGTHLRLRRQQRLLTKRSNLLSLLAGGLLFLKPTTSLGNLQRKRRYQWPTPSLGCVVSGGD